MHRRSPQQRDPRSRVPAAGAGEPLQRRLVDQGAVRAGVAARVVASISCISTPPERPSSISTSNSSRPPEPPRRAAAASSASSGTRSTIPSTARAFTTSPASASGPSSGICTTTGLSAHSPPDTDSPGQASAPPRPETGASSAPSDAFLAVMPAKPWPSCRSALLPAAMGSHGPFSRIPVPPLPDSALAGHLRILLPAGSGRPHSGLPARRGHKRTTTNCQDCHDSTLAGTPGEAGYRWHGGIMR